MMGYLASMSGFIVVDGDTGRLVSDKVYSGIGHAKRNIADGRYANNRQIVELKPELILELLRKNEKEVANDERK